MNTACPCIVYLHGFNSSPQSVKARQLGSYLDERGMAEHYLCPALPPSGRAAIALIEAELAKRPGRRFVFVGSSLGGFYSTWLAEKYDTRAVLLNPGIKPWLDLHSYVGMQQNIYTAKRYELTRAHLEEWEQLWVPAITPSRYFLLVETGDEVLDYRVAVARYAGGRQEVIQGGDHSLQSFVKHIPTILDFAGLPVRQ
jgi:predicted esterase YcpF (UPF0227 family)